MNGTPYPVPPTQSPLGDPVAGVVSTEEEEIEDSSVGSAAVGVVEENRKSAKDTSNASSLDTEDSYSEERSIEEEIVTELKEPTEEPQEAEGSDQPGRGLRSKGPADAIQLGARDRQVAVTETAWKSRATGAEQSTLRGEDRDAEHEARRGEQDSMCIGNR